MTRNQIEASILERRLQLEPFEKIKYFKLPFLCWLGFLMSVTDGFQEFSGIDFSDTSFRIGIALLAIGTLSYKLKSDRLNMIVVEKPTEDFENKLRIYARDMKWIVELDANGAFIFRSVPTKGYLHGHQDNEQAGERIYVFQKRGTVYIKSIDNLDNLAFKIHKGHNLSNERALVAIIKRVAGKT